MVSGWIGLDKVGEHFLVPKHEIVPDEKVKEVVAKFGSTLDSFPKIVADDPAIVEIGAKRGDLIKITRKSPTAGTSIYFRVVS
ncbi:MAG TPA: DNA-directed RNA polymerase subunit H [Candidatus Diapherotrites archaeon]|uniref:DNA-directed RNA polymerase subunit Rpo5 n=1 Tax=Candidatus Iainarchaeum sp. TaxID=3101447 RepID=A0A7J4IWM7_9ARCH|nr:DNA-directed RNA polymerase subunit H [Candidatus Diapherotrites archaeon]